MAKNNGFYYGLPKENKMNKNILIPFDPKPVSVPNGLVLGQAGKGMCFYTKAQIVKEIANGKCK